MRSTAEVVKVKDAFAWIDNERDSTDPATIALRSITRDGSPVQLTAEQARMFAQRLLKLADGLVSLTEREKERATSETNDGD